MFIIIVLLRIESVKGQSGDILISTESTNWLLQKLNLYGKPYECPYMNMAKVSYSKISVVAKNQMFYLKHYWEFEYSSEYSIREFTVYTPFNNIESLLYKPNIPGAVLMFLLNCECAEEIAVYAPNFSTPWKTKRGFYSLSFDSPKSEGDLAQRMMKCINDLKTNKNEKY